MIFDFKQDFGICILIPTIAIGEVGEVGQPGIAIGWLFWTAGVSLA